MPFVRITVFAAKLEVDQIDRLQQNTRELMASIMRKPLVGIAVLVEHITTGTWCIAGKEVGLAAHVEAIIGQGTNTTTEKAQFMDRMMNALRNVLGPNLAEETYVVLHEIDRDYYGRGGLSRAERDRRQADR